MSVLEVILGVVAMATVVFGCSVPIGGYVAPTLGKKAHYSDHIVIGTVTKRIYPDPVFGDMYGNMTYGADVFVRCTYKGGPLGERIVIHGAGVIPGHCTSKELEAGKEYILMLDSPDEQRNTYSQAYTAETYSDRKMNKYLNICGLEMNYAMEGGMIMKRRVCPDALKQRNCERFDPNKVKPGWQIPLLIVGIAVVVVAVAVGVFRFIRRPASTGNNTTPTLTSSKTDMQLVKTACPCARGNLQII